MGNIIVRDYIEEFKKVFSDGINSVVKASQIYVEAIDEDSSLKQKFISSCEDFIPSSAWSGFEAVGRKWLHPKLLMGGGGKYAGKIKKLAYSDQEAIFSGKRFDMFVANGSILKVDIRQIEPSQVDQLLDGGKIRSLQEQKAYIESRKQVLPIEPDLMPYVISGGMVIFKKDVKLNKQDIRRILQEM